MEIGINYICFSNIAISNFHLQGRRKPNFVDQAPN